MTPWVEKHNLTAGDWAQPTWARTSVRTWYRDLNLSAMVARAGIAWPWSQAVPFTITYPTQMPRA